MTPLQSWATLLLLAIGCVAAARIAVATRSEWRELFSRKIDEEGTHNG